MLARSCGPFRPARPPSYFPAHKASADSASLHAFGSTATVAAAAESAYTDATRLSALVAAGFLVIGLGASASLGRGRRPDDPSETVTVTTSEEPA